MIHVRCDESLRGNYAPGDLIVSDTDDKYFPDGIGKLRGTPPRGYDFKFNEILLVVATNPADHDSDNYLVGVVVKH